MKYYAAPMEGITGYLYRNAHHDFFPGADAYFSPFLSANHNYSFQGKEIRDVAPENNISLTLIPQLLTKNAEEFVWGAREMHRIGYREVNLNLGCPSSTVSSKGKGSGFLAYPDELDRFFENVFEAGEKDAGTFPKISVKTRLGYSDPAEAVPLMRIFNRYPICELTIHARVRSAMYGGKPDLEAFGEMYSIRAIPVVYNGDIYTKEDAENITGRFPGLCGIMTGRGLLANPALIRECRGGEPLGHAEWKAFHDRVAKDCFEAYSERVAVGKLKELWFYWERLFPGKRREVLEVKKSRGRMEYTAAVNRLT